MDGVVLQGIPSAVSTDGVSHARQKIASSEMRVAKRRLGIAHRDSVYAKKSRPASPHAGVNMRGVWLDAGAAKDQGLCVSHKVCTFPVNSFQVES